MYYTDTDRQTRIDTPIHTRVHTQRYTDICAHAHTHTHIASKVKVLITHVRFNAIHL